MGVLEKDKKVKHLPHRHRELALNKCMLGLSNGLEKYVLSRCSTVA
jgi:hypothetical protein